MERSPRSVGPEFFQQENICRRQCVSPDRHCTDPDERAGSQITKCLGTNLRFLWGSGTPLVLYNPFYAHRFGLRGGRLKVSPTGFLSVG